MAQLQNEPNEDYLGIHWHVPAERPFLHQNEKHSEIFLISMN